MRKTAKKCAVLVMVAVLLFALVAVCLVGCNKDKSNFTDMIGRKLTINPGTYQRVACIGAGALRMYSYIGDLSLLVAVEDIDNTTREGRPVMFDQAARPYQLANKELFDSIEQSCGIGGPQHQTVADYDEILLECDADIIISELEDVAAADAIQQKVGVPVVTVKYGANGVFDQNVKDSFTMLGKIFGKEQRAAELNAFIDAQTKLISDRTANVAEADKKSVYICGLGNWGTTNHLMTAQNYAPFNVAHIKNAVSGLVKDGIQEIELEALEALGGSIDIMVVDSAAVKNVKPMATKLNSAHIAALENIKAWQDGEVYLEMPYNAYYTNLEIALVNTWWLAKVAYPELFEDIDMTDKTNEVTRAFLGKDLAAEIFACRASFGGYRQIENPSEFFA